MTQHEEMVAAKRDRAAVVRNAAAGRIRAHNARQERQLRGEFPLQKGEPEPKVLQDLQRLYFASSSCVLSDASEELAPGCSEAIKNKVRDVIQKHVHVTDEQKATLISRFNERICVNGALYACGSCGIRDPSAPVFNNVAVGDLPNMFRFEDSELDKLGELDILIAPCEAGQEPCLRRINLWEIKSFYPRTRKPGGHLFHLHAELVEEDPRANGGARVRLCAACETQARAPSGSAQAPVGSLAAGWDAGRLDRVQGLELPSATEQLLLSEVRMYSVVLKVTAEGTQGRSSLRGHMISFIQVVPPPPQPCLAACIASFLNSTVCRVAS